MFAYLKRGEFHVNPWVSQGGGGLEGLVQLEGLPNDDLGLQENPTEVTPETEVTPAAEEPQNQTIGDSKQWSPIKPTPDWARWEK